MLRIRPGFPIRIRTQNVRLNDDLKRSIESEAAALKRFNSRIVDCEVALSGPGRHHRAGGSFSVVVKVALPGPDVVVHRAIAASIPVAINQSFATARRRVKRQAHLRRRRLPIGRTPGLGRRKRPRRRHGTGRKRA